MGSNEIHRWRPGVSGNPSGRPKGFAGVARAIMRETSDGEELVKFALDALRNVHGNRSFAERWDALRWLADRGLGRAVTKLEASVYAEHGLAQASALRLRALTDEQLEALALLDQVDDDALDVIDVPAQLRAGDLEPPDRG